METLPGTTRCEAEYHFHFARWGKQDGCIACRSRASTTSWRKWLDLYAFITISPDLSGVSDSIPYLQIFSDHV